MASFAFTPPNPGGTDPYPIEATLAGQSADPVASRMAFPLLLTYMAQRQMGATDYNNQLAHTNAMQLQANQAAQANDARSRVIDILKLVGERSGAGAAAVSNPLTASLLGGTDLAPLAQGATDANRAENFSRVGSGAQGLRNAGFLPDINAMSGMTGLPLAQGQPPIVDAAEVNGKYRVAAAGVGAGSRGGTTLTLDPTTGTVGGSIKIPGLTPNPQTIQQGLAAIDQGVQGAKAAGVNIRTAAPTAMNGAPVTISNPSQAGAALAKLKSTNLAGYNDVMLNMRKRGNVGVPTQNGKLVGDSGAQY